MIMVVKIQQYFILMKVFLVFNYRAHSKTKLLLKFRKRRESFSKGVGESLSRCNRLVVTLLINRGVSQFSHQLCIFCI